MVAYEGALSLYPFSLSICKPKQLVSFRFTILKNVFHENFGKIWILTKFATIFFVFMFFYALLIDSKEAYFLIKHNEKF